MAKSPSSQPHMKNNNRFAKPSNNAAHPLRSAIYHKQSNYYHTSSHPHSPPTQTTPPPTMASSTSNPAVSAPPPSIPTLKDLTIENITENTIRINNQCSDPRTRYILSRLVTHLHDFARETRLSTNEWMQGIQFLTATGQISTDVRQEFILLSDILGLSLLVDNIDHPKPRGATEGTVLGPFHTHDAADLSMGEELSHDDKGEPMICVCRVKDSQGKGVAGVKIDVWETDSEGFYDVQRAGRTEPDGRGVLHSDAGGKFWYRAVVPVEYPIPHDGPVGKLLKWLGRHAYRPAHMHFMFEKKGYDNLITALYVRGDKYESSDAVFGVKESLIVDIKTVSKEQAKEYGVPESTRLLEWEFVLVSEEETRDLRNKLAKEAMEKLGLERMKIVDGLPVPEVD